MMKHQKISEFLGDGTVLSILSQQKELKNRKEETDFNPFILMSDLYYREEFHSDIIKSILDPKGSHLEGNIFLTLFIELLNKMKPSLRIDHKNYESAIVQRERDNIDILIHGSNHAIIIENKLNNAVDQPRQLPNYYNIVSKRYSVDAVVYISKSGSKSPTYEGWQENELKVITPLLVILGAYTATSQDLAEGWLQYCEIRSMRIESINVIRSYRKLLIKMGTENTNFAIYKEIYEKLLSQEAYSMAVELSKLMSEKLSYIIASRIITTFEQSPHPFRQVNFADNTAVFTDWYPSNTSIVLQCSYYHDRPSPNYDIRIFARNSILPNEIIDVIAKYNFKAVPANGYYKYFNFPDNFTEESTGATNVFTFINTLLKDLKNISF